MTGLVRLLASIAALALSGPAAQPALSVDSAVPYAQRAGAVLRMDVLRPAVRPAGRAPAIVWLHGGGFHAGTRAKMLPYARFFARRGWVAATIDYRLRTRAEVRRHGFAIGERDAGQDAEAAISHLRRNASALGIDPARIVIGGSSAGAITALNVAARGRAPVRAAISFAGQAHAADFGPGDPPLLLVHGDRDLSIPLARAQETCAAAQAAGVRCDLQRVPGAAHHTLLAQKAANARRAAAWLRGLGVA